jgi:ubiquinone/menaquinone biosynthesis C-methylase UbiE
MTNRKPEAKCWDMTPETAQGMLRIAKHGIQSYIHPRLARQVVDDYHITRGECLDIGTGHALLSIEIARITELKVTALDVSPLMVEIARGEVASVGMESRIDVVQGSVVKLPFEDNRFDLIVSRGSAGFWPDKVRALQEIYRVLKPGGRTYIGGGDPRRLPRNPSDFIKMIRFRIFSQKKRLNKEWRRLWLSPGEWRDILEQTGIKDYTIHPGRMWVEMRK